MGFTSLNTSDLETGKRITSELMNTIKTDLDYLYSYVLSAGAGGGAAGGGIVNGGFELDEGNTGQPDNWDITYYTGGESTLVTTATTWADPLSESKSLCFIKQAGAGNGGGIAMSDYFPVSTNEFFELRFKIKSDTTNVTNWVNLYMYDESKSYNTYKRLYDDAASAAGTYITLQSTLTEMRTAITSLKGLSTSYLPWGKIGISCGNTGSTAEARVLIDDVAINNDGHIKTIYYGTMSTEACVLVHTWGSVIPPPPVTIPDPDYNALAWSTYSVDLSGYSTHQMLMNVSGQLRVSMHQTKVESSGDVPGSSATPMRHIHVTLSWGEETTQILTINTDNPGSTDRYYFNFVAKSGLYPKNMLSVMVESSYDSSDGGGWDATASVAVDHVAINIINPYLSVT